MKYPRVEMAAAAQASRSQVSTYQLTLNGLRTSVLLQAGFNALAALALLLLGHPIAAAIALVSYCGIDFVQQRFVRRWIGEAAGADEAKGFTRVAVLSAVRFSIYIAPTLAVALSGGPAELLLFASQAATLTCIAMQAGAMARRVFWGFTAPVLAAFATVCLTRLNPLAATAVLISVASLAAIMSMLLEGTYRTIGVLHAAFNEKTAMIPQLEAQRTAADDAREAARAATRSKADFLATMSHEIRTPMNGVLGMAQLLKRDETDPVQAARIGVLIDSGEYLLGILNDILDVSKIDAGRLDILPAPEAVGPFFERLVGFWGPRADEKGLALSLEVADGAPEAVLVDGLRLRQVLFNLVGNALKFTEAGSVAISVRATPNGDGATLLHVAVADTGVGIAPEQLPNLFNRFSQADESEVRRFGGTGLGLAIAKQLAELMGGRIWAESEPGRGSTFHLKLPLAVCALPTPAPAEATVENAEPLPLNVLAVDDNAVNLLVLDQLLASFGHRVARAVNGPEALQAMAAERFDVVLLDIQMPQMTGTEVLQRLRAGDSPNWDAPVVALTADVTSGGRQRYLELGFTEHCSKPIQVSELTASIVRAMSADPRGRQAVKAVSNVSR